MGQRCCCVFLLLFGAAPWAVSVVCVCFVFCLDVDRNGKHPASSCTAFIGSIGTSLQSPTRPMIVLDFWRCPSTSLDLINGQYPRSQCSATAVDRAQFRPGGEEDDGSSNEMMEAPTFAFGSQC